MRPIDGDALKNLMCEMLEGIIRNHRMVGEEYHIIAAIRMLGQMIDDAETIATLPVIRCKDCKWREEYHVIPNPDDTMYWCGLHYSDNSMIGREPNDFCSYAERKEE